MKYLKRYISAILVVIILASFVALPAQAAGTIMYGIGFVNANSLRLRSQPSTASRILDTAYNNECVVVMGKSGDWYHVNYNLQDGYMHKDYLEIAKRENAELGYGTVNGSSVNLRSGPGIGYRVLAVASKNEKCYIIGLNEGWYKVIYGNIICYIRSDYLKLTEIPYENRDSENTPRFFRNGKSTGTYPSASALNGTSNTTSSTNSPSNSVTGTQIVNEAKKYLGIPYVYGGTSPSGFDCSGLVYYVLRTLGFSPYRTPESQYNQGTYVSKNNLKPGDIVFFANTGGTGITHVGIYAGNGQFIHSPNSRSTVSYASLTSGYWSDHYYGARRVA